MNERKAFLLSAIAALGLVVFIMLQPFIGVIMTASVFAFVLFPVHKRFRKYINSSVSAFLVLLVGIFLAVIPFLYAGSAIANDAVDLSSELDSSQLVNVTEAEQKIFEITGQSVDLESRIQSSLSSFSDVLFGSVSGLVGMVSGLFISLVLTLFLTFYFIRDGERLVLWFKSLVPLPKEVSDSLIDRTRKTTWSVVKGHILVAIVSGIVGGIGFYIVGISNVMFWTFLMIILSFIPMVGSTIVWLPAAAYLALVGELYSGVFLFLYGLVVMGAVDNIVRPLVVDKESDLHPASIIIGVIGGLYLFGAIGMLIGPIVIAVFKSALTVYRNSYNEL